MTGIIVLIIYALIMVGATILMTNKRRKHGKVLWETEILGGLYQH